MRSGMSWFKAQTLMASARSPREGKPLQNNTRLYVADDGVSFDVVLHRTAVVTIHPDDTYTLRTGGWHTMTTAQRIRQYSPAQVGTFKGEYSVFGHGYRVPFREGMRVDASGEPVDDHGFTIGKLVKTKGA